MTKKRFKVNKSAKVGIDISSSGEIGVTQKKSSIPKGVIPTEEQDELYVLRKRESGLRIFDLSTRLRSIPTVVSDGLRRREYPTTDDTTPQNDFSDEYVSIPFEVHGVHTSYYMGVDEIHRSYHHQWYPNIQMNEAEWQRLDAMLLGSLKIVSTGQPVDDIVDPTGFSQANGSARILPHSKETGSSVKIGDVWLDFAGWTNREPQEADNDERWIEGIPEGIEFPRKIPKNYFNDKAGSVQLWRYGWVVGDGDGIDISNAEVPDDVDAVAFYALPDGRVLLSGKNSYIPVVTNSPYVKITEEASFDAPTKTYNFSGDDNRFYLRPMLSGFRITSTPSFEPGPNYFPADYVIPQAYWVAQRDGVNPCTSEFIPKPLAPDAWLHVCSINLEPIPVEFADNISFPQFLDKVVSQGSLIAIIAQKVKRYYVWAATNYYSRLDHIASASEFLQRYGPISCS